MNTNTRLKKLETQLGHSDLPEPTTILITPLGEDDSKINHIGGVARIAGETWPDFKARAIRDIRARTNKAPNEVMLMTGGFEAETANEY